MRWLTLALVVLIAALQYPLWLGKGSWLRVWQVDQELAQQKETNQKLRARNSSMDAEVRDLKQGYDAIEERARSELGMIKDNEVFFQVLEDKSSSGAKSSPQNQPPKGQSITKEVTLPPPLTREVSKH
jgi:cell division protein FtsB